MSFMAWPLQLNLLILWWMISAPVLYEPNARRNFDIVSMELGYSLFWGRTQPNVTDLSRSRYIMLRIRKLETHGSRSFPRHWLRLVYKVLGCDWLTDNIKTETNTKIRRVSWIPLITCYYSGTSVQKLHHTQQQFTWFALGTTLGRLRLVQACRTPHNKVAADACLVIPHFLWGRDGYCNWVIEPNALLSIAHRKTDLYLTCSNFNTL